MSGRRLHAGAVGGSGARTPAAGGLACCQHVQTGGSSAQARHSTLAMQPAMKAVRSGLLPATAAAADAGRRCG